VAGAVERLGREPVVTDDPGVLEQAERLILPGVGAFADGMRNLEQRGLVGPLTELVVEQRRPVLGICLGAQLMARESVEFGHTPGLGWVSADVRRIEPSDASLRVPHVGWNSLLRTQETPLLEGVADEPLFYFVHSFHIACDDPELVKAEVEYGGRMTAVF